MDGDRALRYPAPTMAEEPVLQLERVGAIATLTLNRPRSLNALSRELRARLAEAFVELASDDATRVVILTGAGRAFTAGLDLKELGTGGATAEDAVETEDPVRALARLPQPVIGAINGFAITGGFELALACDILIASTEARFADTHARIGIMPGWGLSQRLSRAIGIYRAKELSLTGNYLDATRALEWGLVSRVVAPEQLLPEARAIAADMLSCDPVLLRNYKRIIDDGFALPLGEGQRLERRRSAEFSRGVTAASIEARRSEVQARGRTQTND